MLFRSGHTAPEVLVHCVGAAPNGSIVECIPWMFDLWQEPPQLEDGLLVAPDRPGIGVTLDEAALAKYRVE